MFQYEIYTKLQIFKHTSMCLPIPNERENHSEQIRIESDEKKSFLAICVSFSLVAERFLATIHLYK